MSSFPILLVEDDLLDLQLAREAFLEVGVDNEIHHVRDGEELLAFLRRDGQFEGRPLPRPGLIILDLNMPRLDGPAAIEQIRRDPHLRTIPIVVMTTSSNEVDVQRAYRLGASAYVVKPNTFGDLVDQIGQVVRFWCGTARIVQPDEQPRELEGVGS